MVIQLDPPPPLPPRPRDQIKQADDRRPGELPHETFMRLVAGEGADIPTDNVAIKIGRAFHKLINSDDEPKNEVQVVAKTVEEVRGQALPQPQQPQQPVFEETKRQIQPSEPSVLPAQEENADSNSNTAALPPDVARTEPTLPAVTPTQIPGAEVSQVVDAKIEPVKNLTKAQIVAVKVKEFLWKLLKFVLLPLRLIGKLILFLWNIDENVDSIKKTIDKVDHLVTEVDKLLVSVNEAKLAEKIGGLLQPVGEIIKELKEHGVALDIATMTKSAADICKEVTSEGHLKALIGEAIKIMSNVSVILAKVNSDEGVKALLGKEILTKFERVMKDVETIIEAVANSEGIIPATAGINAIFTTMKKIYFERKNAQIEIDNAQKEIDAAQVTVTERDGLILLGK